MGLAALAAGGALVLLVLVAEGVVVLHFYILW